MLSISPLRLGTFASLATLAFAGVAGLIAVADADEVQSALGVGLGVALTVFAAGATIVCGLACLGRRRVEPLALGAVVTAGVTVDLLVLAIWLNIQSEVYGKVVGVGFVWIFTGLLVLGLTLALGSPGDIARALYLAAVVSALAVGLIATWLVVTAGSDVGFRDPLSAVDNDGLLRALGAAFVLAAAFWFAALAAARLETASD